MASVAAAVAIGVLAAVPAATTPAGASTSTSPVAVARLAGAAEEIVLAGPVLAGDSVVWAQTTASGVVTVRAARGDGRIRTLARLPLPAPPPGADPEIGYDVRMIQRVTAIAASSSTVGFVRTAFLVRDPVCRRLSPPCGVPPTVETTLADLWRGTPGGLFKRVAGGPFRRQAEACVRRQPVDVAVVGNTIVYSERTTTCAREQPRVTGSRVIRRAASGTKTDLAISRMPISSVAAAGKYVAWASNISDELGAAPVAGPSEVVVYDVSRKALAYRTPARDFHARTLVLFDLQQDGKLGFAADGDASGTCYGRLRVGWTSPRGRVHLLAIRATVPAIRFARDRLLAGAAAATARCGTAPPVKAVDLRGRSKVVARPAAGAFTLYRHFDFDGRSFALAYVTGHETGGTVSFTTTIYRGHA